jgi:hypothetical protein
VWTAIVRSERDAPARQTGGAVLPGGIAFRMTYRWALLAWAALLIVIAMSFRPAVPVIWGDTPPFVESALRTLEAGRPTVAGGRDPGYPAFLAATLAFGGDFATVVKLQQAAWAVLMVTLAATIQLVTRNPLGLVPIILVATYPGLLMVRNVLTAELPFAVLLNLTMAGLLVATCAGKTARCWLVAAAIFGAALAACFRSQGLLIPIVAILAGLGLARPDTPMRVAVMAVSIAAALTLLATGSRIGATSSDRASAVFVSKTLFCNHLNIVLASDAARREIAAIAGDRSGAVMARLAGDIAAEPGRWPVLGFFGDTCLFDTTLDRNVAGDSASPATAAAAYRRIFLTAVLDQPIAYAAKVIRQMAYAAWVAWPPYGLEPTITVSTDDVPHVSDIMTRHGRPLRPGDLQGPPVRIGFTAEHPDISAYLYRMLSLAFIVAVLFWTVTALRWWRLGFVTRAGLVILMWSASIATAAAAHTIDEWRYLVPSVPLVGLMLSLFAVELADLITSRPTVAS